MNYVTLYSFIAFLLILPLPGQAAGLIFNLDGDSKVVVFIEAESETINAFSGTLQVSNAKSVHSFSIGNSVAPLWPQQPVRSSNGNTHTINFSGIILSGFSTVNTPNGSTRPGRLFSFVVEPETNQEAVVELVSGHGYLNDGLGTEIDLSGGRLSITSTGEVENEIEVLIPDVIPPKVTGAEIIFEENLFEGKPTLIFNTNDNDTGVLSVNLIIGGETIENISSPYLLPEFDSEQTLTIRVIDVLGNSTSTTLIYTPAKQSESLSEDSESDSKNLWICGLLILLLLIVLIFFLRRRKERQPYSSR